MDARLWRICSVILIFPLALTIVGCAAAPTATAVPTATSTIVSTATIPPATPTIAPSATATKPAATATLAASATSTPSATATATKTVTTTASTKPTPTATGKTACLSCHGPFDKLIASDASFTMPDGAKVNPHRYVPHDQKDAASVPECTDCHNAHPIPPTPNDLAGLPKPNVDTCFSCHHLKNFTPCAKCHGQ